MKPKIKTDLTIKTNHVIGLVALGAVVYVGYRGYSQAKQLAAGAVEAVNPVSDKNIVYRSVDGVGAALTGNKHFSLGSQIYDWFNPAANESVVDGDYKTMVEGLEPINE